MHKLPTQFLKLRVLSNVPLSDFAEVSPPQNLSDEKQRLGFLKLLRKAPVESAPRYSLPRRLELNAAAWLSFPQALSSPVSLWLCYQDDKGEEAILVDEQTMLEPGSAMLSGNISLRFRGEVQYLKICCGGLKNDDRFSVEELHVKQVESASRRNLKAG